MSSKQNRNSFPRQVIGRYPATLTAADILASADAAQDEDAPDPIPFTPVPRQRRRRDGWTEQKQRDFIACLQLTGSISASARAVA